MIPILFDKTETSFTSNGLCRLPDCKSCLVTEERNGIFECEFEYPVSGENFDLISEGRIIGCTHDEQGDIQPFDIYARSEPIDGVVTFYAHHISYRLNEIVVKPFTSGSVADAINKLSTESLGTNPFTFWTDKSTVANFSLDVPKGIRNVLGGEEGSFLDAFGSGEYDFDKFTVRFYSHRGQDTNISIRYGKNLVDLTNEYSVKDAYTAVVPFWLGNVQDDSGTESEATTVFVHAPNWIVSSGNTVPSGREVIVPMDLSSEFDTQPTETQVAAAAAARMTSGQPWVPYQTMRVDFVQLWQTEEYKDYAPLQRLRLCDTCGVFVPMYGISVRAKVIRVVYNALLDRYDEMELGDKPTTYAAVIEKDYSSKVDAIYQGFKAIGVDLAVVKTNANSYTDGAIAGLRSDLEAQIDAKIETWAQSTDPAASWTTAALKAEHTSDLWLYTGITQITVGGVTIKPQGVYQYNGSTWAAYSSTSNNLFDLADGKKVIYYGTTSDTFTPTPSNGDLLIDTTTGKQYKRNGSSWVEVSDYKGYTDSQITASEGRTQTAYEAAISAATELLRGGTGGYVITTLNANGQPIEICIADNMDLSQAVNVWRWNQNGLGFSSSGYNGTYTTAITADGKIVADFITTGVLTANIIKAGVLADANSNTSFDLATGTLTMKKGSIDLGSGLFVVTNAGALTATSGKIAAFDLSANGLTFLNSSNTVKYALSNNGLYIQNYASNYGRCIHLHRGEARFYSKYNASGVDDYGSSYMSLRGNSVNSIPFIQFLANGSEVAFLSSAQFAVDHDIACETINKIDNTGQSSLTSLFISNGLEVYGTKQRIVDTPNYGERGLYCYEMPAPMFGDIGEAVLDETGICYVDIDDIFSETIDSIIEYQVFLQKEGEGDCWIADKQPRFFVIQGTPTLKVAWELKAKQRDYETTRLEQRGRGLEEYEKVSDQLGNLERYITEQEELLYG